MEHTEVSFSLTHRRSGTAVGSFWLVRVVSSLDNWSIGTAVYRLEPVVSALENWSIGTAVYRLEPVVSSLENWSMGIAVYRHSSLKQRII